MDVLTGLILALAMVGQPQWGAASSGQFGREVQRISYSPSQPTSAKEWSEIACEVITDEPDGTHGMGSGTVLRSNEHGEELVLTAKHVVNHQKTPVSVRWKGQRYPARFIAASDIGDVAAIRVNLPGTVKALELATHAPERATVVGYGRSRRLHQHAIRYIGQVYGDHDDVYGPGGNEGDSGAGVFTPSGQLCGVFVAYETRTHNSIAVSARTICQFLAPAEQVQAQARGTSGRTSMVVFPFFWFRKQWNGGAGDICQQPAPIRPVQPVQPMQPPEPIDPPFGEGAATAGPPGPQGPPGPAGPPGQPGAPGKDNTADIAALVAAQKENADQIQILIGEVTQLKNRPAVDLTPLQNDITAIKAQLAKGITFVTPNLDGTSSQQTVLLGGTIGMKIPQSAPTQGK